MAQPVKDQPSSGPPPKGLRFNPIYMEPGSTSIDSTRDLQAVVPQQLQLHRWHVRRIRHQNRPYSPSSTTQKMESPHWVQGGDQKRAGRDGMSRNHHQTDWAHTMGQLSHIPQEGKQQVEDMPWPKGLEQSHHPWESQGTNPWGDSPCTHRSNQILQSGWQQSFLWNAPDRGSFTPHDIQHTPQQVQISLCTIWTQNEPGHFPDENGWHCSPMPRSIGHTWWCVHLWEGWQRPWCQHHKPVQHSQKEGLIFNSSKCSIKQDSCDILWWHVLSQWILTRSRKDPRHHRDDTPSNKAGTTIIFRSGKLPSNIHPPPQSSHWTATCALLKKENSFAWDENSNTSFQKLNPYCRSIAETPEVLWQKQTSHPPVWCFTQGTWRLASSKMAIP